MREQIIAMLREVPGDTVIQRFMSRTDTAESLITEIQLNTEIGLEFITALLRISRDMLIRSARPKGDRPDSGGNTIPL